MLLPFVPLREIVLFPRAIEDIPIGRPGSVWALNRAMGLTHVEEGTRAHRGIGEDTRARPTIAVVTQRTNADWPTRDDLYDVGCEVRIIDGVYHDGTWHLRLMAERRVELIALESCGDGVLAHVEPLATAHAMTADLAPRAAAVKLRTRRLIERSDPSNPMIVLVDSIDDPEHLASFLGSQLHAEGIEVQQAILGTRDIGERLDLITRLLDAQLAQ